MEKYFVKRKERSFIRKKDSFIFKKIYSTLRLSLPQLKTGFCSKIDLGKNRKKIILEGLGGNYFFVHDLRNLQNSKIYFFFEVFVSTTEYLLYVYLIKRALLPLQCSTFSSVECCR